MNRVDSQQKNWMSENLIPFRFGQFGAHKKLRISEIRLKSDI